MHDFLKINQWNEKLTDCNFVVIAGPCAAETSQQISEIAIELAKIPYVKAFRAGIWKPRTKPSEFQGVGDNAIEWLTKVKQNTQLLTCIEVANQHHVEIAQKNNIDIIWLGARTTVNPFYVQEIANSLQNKDLIVLVKNPINPDIKLWIGAIERIYRAGIRKIAAVFRGFHPFETSKYRNIPKWEYIIDLKTHFPNIPIIIDPSHIAGKSELIEEIMRISLPFCPDGFMIEVHNNPSQALSDARQQITPQQLAEIIDKLQLNCNKRIVEDNWQLQKYRQIIDSIDFQIIELIAKRFQIVEQIGHYKAQNNIDIFQVERWREIIKSRLSYAQKLNINTEFAKQMMQIIHLQSIKIQSEINKNNTK